jgi:hypothetical protein
MEIKASDDEGDFIAEEERIGGFGLWAISLGVSLTMSIIVFILQYLRDNYVLELTNFKDRTIGIAVISGVDTALRTQLYVEFILGAIILLGVFFVLFDYISKKYLNSVPVSFEKQIIFYTSLFAIASTFLYVTSKQALFLNNLLLLYFIIALLSLFILIKVIARYRKCKSVSDVFSKEIITLSLIFPFITYVAYLVLFDKSLNFVNDAHHYLPLFILWSLFLATYYLLNQSYRGLEDHNLLISNLILLSFIPALLIPISIPLSNELQFTLSGLVHIEPRLLSGMIAVFLLLSSLVLFVVLSKRESMKVLSARVIGDVYFPIIIATATLFRYYQHSLVIGAYDMFHHGELLISNQQLFSFNSLPYIGIYPTHGLSEMYYQVLYSLVNGYRPVEPILWSWITPVIGAMLVYFILKNIIDPFFSLMAILFVPITDIVGGSCYAMSMLIAFCFIWTMKRMTLFRSALLWLSLIFLLFWRLDIGVAAIAGIIFIFSIIHIKNVFIESHEWCVGRNFGLSFIIVTFLFSTLFALLIVLNKESISQIILQNIQFAVYQNQVMAYTDIISSYSNLVVLQYGILPCISIVYVIYFVFKFLMRKENPSANQIILVFFAVFSLIMSIRSVQRHSLMEFYNSYLFVFLLICMPFYIKLKQSTSKILFLGLLLAYLLAMPSYTIMLNNQNANFFDYHDWQSKEKRVSDNKSQYQDIVLFIDGYLKENQTFFDFTNSPIIYIFADKKHIPYIIPNLYQTSELIQNITLEKLEDYHDKGDLTIVIFKQGNYWWDNVDSVPNEIRCYRIAEFIYRNYKPMGFINQYQIWVEKNSSLSNIYNQNEVIKPIKFKLQEIALNDINKISADKLAFKCGSYDPFFYNFLDLSSADSLNKTHYLSLRIRYKSTLAGSLQVFYGYNGSPFEELYSSRVILENNSQNYSELLVPIPPGKIGLTDIRFDPPSNSVFEVDSVELSERKTNLYPISSKDIQQDFDLKKLPYIWGKYDGKDALINTEIPEEMNKSQVKLDKDQEVTFFFDPILDKSSGNYIHFKIKSTHNSTLTIKYGNKSMSSIGFQVIPSAEYEDYLVRISSQWLWMAEPISRITIKTSEAVEIGRILIRSGDYKVKNVTEAGYAPTAYDLTDQYWDRGIGRNWTGFFITHNERLKVGDKVVLRSGIRAIERLIDNGPYTNVYLNGSLLNPIIDGNPNPIYYG